jgi:type II secretory pathway component GspD/PulD (secretin)
MRITKVRLCLFILFFCLFLPRLFAGQDLPFLNENGDDVRITMDLKDAGLKDILKILSIQSGLNFIASEAVQDRSMTIFLDNVPLKGAMDKLFTANNLTYELDEDSKIFIVKDWGKPEIQTMTKVYYLKNRTVPSAKIEKETQELLKNGSEGVDIVTSIKQVLSAHGKINEDTRTNSLIITDIPSRFPVIEQVIARLDISVPQVVIDVEMLDVSKDVVDKLGFQFNENPFTLILPGGFARRGAEYFVGNLAHKGKDLSSAVAGLVSFGRTYSEVLDFLRTQSDTKYLARPRLLTLNNETAEISITKDEIVTLKSVWISNSSEAGGGHWEQEYERATALTLTPEGVGIFLRLTPFINEETGEITMVINPKSSSTTQNAQITTQVALDPEVRSTKSVVKMKDGQTVVVGGLIHNQKLVVTTKVPILGDIPILGVFFRHKNQTKDMEREVLVFITPRIVKDTAEISQSPKMSLLQKGQNTATMFDRKSAIDTSLNSFERMMK